MTAKIIDGKLIAAQERDELSQKIAADESEDMPVLAVVLVGNNDASRIYVRNKKKAAAEVGIGCEVLEFAESIGENALLEVIDELNDNPHINGIIVQLPLPSHINSLRVLSKIRPDKDVDGFNPYNAGLLACREPEAIVSATPRGILKLLETTGIKLVGKHVVIIGRSNIVGRPVAMLLLNQDCTVSITHSKTENLPEIVFPTGVMECSDEVFRDYKRRTASPIFKYPESSLLSPFHHSECSPGNSAASNLASLFRLRDE